MMSGVRTVYGVDVNYIPIVDQQQYGAGHVRYSSAGGESSLEVWNGFSWVPIKITCTMVSLDAHTQEILNWADKQRLREQELDRLCQQHAAVRDARDQLEILIRLVRENSQIT